MKYDIRIPAALIASLLAASMLFKHGSSAIYPILYPVLAGTIVYLFRRQGALSSAGGAAPQSPPRPPRAARGGEAAMLLLGGLFMLASMLHGTPLASDQTMPPPLIHAYESVAAIILAAIALGAFAAWRGRTATGLVIVLVSLVALLLALTRSRHEGDSNYICWIDTLAGADSGPFTNYTFDLEQPIDGAELWINDTALGKMPVNLTSKEFKAMIPVWDAPPAGEPVQTLRSRLSPAELSPWVLFTIADPDDFGKQSTYFARVRMAGLPFTLQRGGGGGGGGLVRRYNQDFRALIAGRDERLKSLLTQATALDDRVPPEWFEALASYGDDGWLALDAAAQGDGWGTSRSPAQKDPALQAMADRWIRERFGLDQIQSPDAAWAALERIERGMPRGGSLGPESPELRAIAVLAPRLDARRLAKAAAELVPRQGFASFSLRINDPATASLIQSMMNDDEGTSASQHAYAIAYAAGARIAWAKQHDGAGIDPLQEILAPELLRWTRERPAALDAAAAIGGPAVERYLLRQNWQAKVEFGRGDWMDKSKAIHAVTQVNKYLYALCSLDDAAGRQFRSKHPDAVLGLADAVMASRIAETNGIRDLPFLFRDSERGKASPAMAYWPRYQAKMQDAFMLGMRQAWTYLAAMEPATPTGLYADSWKAVGEGGSERSPNMPFSELESLPRARRIEILQSLEAALNPQRRQVPGSPPNQDDDHLIAIRKALFMAGDPATVREALDAPIGDRGNKIARDWFRYDRYNRWADDIEADNPLVEMLATAADPEFRQASVVAAEAMPTAAHRELLAKLASDADDAVRQDAAAAHERLAKLAATPPAELAAPRIVQQPSGDGA